MNTIAKSAVKPGTHPQFTLFLINKASGMTSFDVIRRLKKKFNHRDLGHAGTLDSFATGLLPILAFEGLKFVRFFQEPYPHLSTYWKTYTGRITLGYVTDTADPTGTVTARAENIAPLTRDKIETNLARFRNSTYMQMPPIFSAKKISGERASDLARKGVDVELKASQVTIKSFDCVDFGSDWMSFRVECSKGTYIRSLVQDFLAQLGTIGILTALCREEVGALQLKYALTLEQIEASENVPALHKSSPTSVLTIQDTARLLPAFELQADEIASLRRGQITPACTRLANSGLPANAYCAWDEGLKSPIALFELDAEKRATYLKLLNCEG